MNQEFTIQQLADAAQLTRYQVEAWISRGHFKPENPVENGKARKFTADDAVVLAALAEFNRLGLAPTTVSMHTTQLRYRAGRGSLFVITSIMRKATEPEGEIDRTAGEISDANDQPWRRGDDHERFELKPPGLHSEQQYVGVRRWRWCTARHGWQHGW